MNKEDKKFYSDLSDGLQKAKERIKTHASEIYYSKVVKHIPLTSEEIDILNSATTILKQEEKR